MTDDCLFCKVIAGDVPSEKVAETERTYAFRDINPVAPVHVLVVPKEHVDSLATLDPEAQAATLADTVGMVQEVARSEGIVDDGYRVVANVGRHGGMTVAHLHWHLIGGRPLKWPPE